MKRFRQTLFWIHLVCGLVTGAVIGIMCFTGAALAFEHELVAWTERDVRRVTPPAPAAARLSLDELQLHLRAAHPDIKPTGIIVLNDPAAAVTFSVGREGTFYANPYTGEIRQPASPNRLHDFLHVLESWHRTLALSGDQRATGKLINGICNLAFFGLAITGLYLWWPRQWNWRSLKPSVWFMQNYRGKARDLNWHTVIGFWTAPVLIVLTLTAVPISFRWGGTFISWIAGEAPAAQAPAAPASPALTIPPPAPGAKPLGYSALFAATESNFPHWEQITLRLVAPAPRGGAPQPPAATAPAADRPRDGTGERRSGEGRSAPTPITAVVKEPGQWPRTASTTLTLNPFTGDVLKREGYADLPTSRQIRSWTRFLHTGQALGWPGQLIAGLACVGGCFLVYTGFALSWRRFFGQAARARRAAAKSGT